MSDCRPTIAAVGDGEPRVGLDVDAGAVGEHAGRADPDADGVALDRDLGAAVLGVGHGASEGGDLCVRRRR